MQTSNTKAETISLQELKKLVKELFKHYRRRKVYEDEFYNYFKAKGFSEEDIDILWVRVIGESNLIKIGVHLQADKLPPKKVKERPFIELFG